MSADLLAEFKRLCEEANDVALSRDEYFTLIYQAAVNLYTGSWAAPTEPSTIEPPLGVPD